ncbi:MAG TPA: nucleoside recognition domain-containing protein [Hydrogenophilus thermoluteolus]|nr:nucleoside recognition domain-containing protein [Hydrogenophilus thermoluteolus]
MNRFFLFLVVTAFATAAWRETTSAPGTMAALSKAAIDGAGQAVTLAIGLVGVMSLFLGLMRIAEAGGLLLIIARLLQPLMVRLFPDVPANHPAMGAMVMNFSANLLGLGNAATPFGIRAMEALERLNPHPGTATNAMAMFLALNTSGLTLLPTGVIALRASLGSNDPAAILPTTLIATTCATLTAGFAAWGLARFFPAGSRRTVVKPMDEAPSDVHGAAATQELPPPPEATLDPQTQAALEETPSLPPYPLWATGLFFAGILALIPVSLAVGAALSAWLVPGLIVLFLLFGAVRRVPVYEQFVEGARDGFQVALRIIPYLVAILVAVAMLRASGALDAFVILLSPLTAPIGLPAEALPMALLRPFSGSGAYAVMASILSDPATGPDTLVGWLVSTLQGSTETTFYVLAVYFGAVGIKRIRHTLAAALLADLAGIAAAVAAVHWLYPDV